MPQSLAAQSMIAAARTSGVGNGSGWVFTASRALDDACALAQEFEDVCLEFSSPVQAREYGTDCLPVCAEATNRAAMRAEAGNIVPPGPKRGSLRVFAQQVLDKVSRKGCTTYQAIADELIYELQEAKRQARSAELAGQDPACKRRKLTDAGDDGDGEKNIRRRVYDSLNVLKAVGAVIPLKGLTGTGNKEVVWAGLPASLEEVKAAQRMQEELKARVREVQERHEQLQILAKRYQLLTALAQLNRERHGNGAPRDAANAVIPLPFVLLTADSDAACNADLDEDNMSAVFHFQTTPFQVLEDYTVLDQMNLLSEDAMRPY